MLRLRLSLIIEYEGDIPPPLPNLKYKIGEGDTLAAPLAGAAQMVMHEEALREFVRQKGEYLRAHGEEKKSLQNEIETLRNEIRMWTHSGEDIQGFDWVVEFAEVFAPRDEPTTVFGTLNLGMQLPSTPAPGGFDIVLANPPYVRQELIKDQKPQLKKIFGDNFSGTADLYVFFYLRAHELLAPGGMIAFISPNKWFRAAYGAKLRKYFSAQTAVRSITDFGDLPVFQAATAYPMVFIAQRTASVSDRPKHQTQFALIKSLEPPYPDVRALMDEYSAPLPDGALDGENWNLSDAATSTRLALMRKAGTPLGEYADARFYRGLSTGFNDAFIIDGSTRDALIKADRKSAELIRPYSAGRDMHKWVMDYKDKWIIYSPWDLNVKKYPAIEQHLQKWKSDLETRPECKQGRYKWWCMARYGAEYVHLFDRPKIISTKISLRPTFSFDSKGCFLGNTTYFLAVEKDAFYLLGLLNSNTFLEYAKRAFVEKQNGWYEVQPKGLEAFTIPTPAPSDRGAIEELVASCLAKRGVGCEAEEAEINARVAKLYGLE